MADPASWAAAVGAVLSAIFAFFKWLLPFLTGLGEVATSMRSTLEGFSKYQKLYLALQAIEDSGVQRSIVFAGHNSGGVPKPGSPFYVSALHWSTRVSRTEEAPPKYQNLPVDAGYISMLVQSNVRR